MSLFVFDIRLTIIRAFELHSGNDNWRKPFVWIGSSVELYVPIQKDLPRYIGTYLYR